MLKPLIKECIKECIFEEGVLSGIITEVSKGLANQRIVTEGITIESKSNTPDPKELEKKAAILEEQRQERIKKLNQSMPFKGVDVFEGTKEILPEGNQHSALAGTAPGDSGVDISGILKLANGKWKHLV